MVASRWVIRFSLLLSGVVPAAAQSLPVAPASRPAEQSVEAEVVENIRAQTIGRHTFADYGYPEEFLRRVADRIIRSSYEKRFRIIVHDGDADGAATTGPASKPAESQPASAQATPQPASAPAIRLASAEVPDAVRAWWSGLREGHPPLVGFRAPLDFSNFEPWPFDPPADSAPEEIRRAARLVGEKLASEGLLPTLALAIEAIGPDKLNASEQPLRLLQSIGLPIDWLAYFSAAGKSPQAVPLVREIARRMDSGEKAAALQAELQSYRFAFRPSVAGFRVADEAGRHKLELLRVQATRGTHWLNAGDGGSLDMTLQLIEKLPDTNFFVSVQQSHLAELTRALRSGVRGRSGEIVIAAEPLPVAQWAADNAKVGFARERGVLQRITLAPRYASRGEDGSTFVPGESVVLSAFAAAGHNVVQSPLLFQGGNLIAVHEPIDNRRTLLVGEAEILRNQILGLTHQQVLDALRIEFGVDRCIVLPAAAYHIDYEVSVRVIDDKIIAFVNDQAAAAGIILDRGIGVLEKNALLSADDATAARTMLKKGLIREFVPLVGNAVNRMAVDFGVYRESLAKMFVDGPADSGVANFQCFLLAIDIIMAQAVPENEVPMSRPGGYVRALRRSESLRGEMRRSLEGLGWKVVPVPSLSAADRSINYLNGVHTRGQYLMPAWGGLYKPLDDAAMQAFREALGPSVKLIPILSGESQRRNGAVRCALGVYPRDDR